MTSRQPMHTPEKHTDTRGTQIATAFSLRSTSGRISLVLVTLALALLATPFVLDWLTQQEREPTTALEKAEPWPTAPATYAAPVAPPALTLRTMPTAVPLPAPQWREMSQLTVIELLMSTVVNVERRANVTLLGEVVTDQLLLKATGEIQMGIDLSQVHDIVIEDSSIRFKVPKPEIVSVELLPDKSEIYDRYQAFLLSNYTGLETEALEVARQQLRVDAAENGAMQTLAEEYAKLKLTEFLRNVGYTDVAVTFVEGGVLP